MGEMGQRGLDRIARIRNRSHHPMYWVSQMRIARRDTEEAAGKVYVHPTEHRIFVHRKREKTYKEMDQGVQERELVIDLTFYPDTDSGGAEFNLCTRSGKRTGL